MKLWVSYKVRGFDGGGKRFEAGPYEEGPELDSHLNDISGYDHIYDVRVVTVGGIPVEHLRTIERTVERSTGMPVEEIRRMPLEDIRKLAEERAKATKRR